MIANIEENIYVGDENSCFYEQKSDWIVIHACKSPCHQRAISYRGNLSPSHPNYLIKEDGNHLFLNMVDMAIPLDPKFADPIISKAINFIKNNQGKKVLIHCNQGFSRSPALALLYLAKITKSISDDSYESAKSDFLHKYPNYSPGHGIEKYLIAHWNRINNLFLE